jgi:hypothetical protein
MKEESSATGICACPRREKTLRKVVSEGERNFFRKIDNFSFSAGIAQ